MVGERLRGLERELDAAADEGVVETLVADAALIRLELADVETDFATLAPTRLEVEVNPVLAERGARVVTALRETLLLHNRYIVEHQTDLPEVSDRQWVRSGDPIDPAAADTAADHG